jgi:hypothetical protein
LVSEGTAEYFALRPMDDSSTQDILAVDVPSLIGPTGYEIQRAGYYFVAPILDTLGVADGVQYLVDHPLTGVDTMTLDAYRTEAMAQL